jgi:putative flippase GtrA
MMKKNFRIRFIPENKKKFLRFQLTAIIATTADFLVTIGLKEIYEVNYSLAVAIGATAGAITAFTINRYWVFKALELHPLEQGMRYLFVAMGSVILNTTGTWMLTEFFQFPYIVSKAIIALIVGFTYSYYFSKRFVFYA